MAGWDSGRVHTVAMGRGETEMENTEDASTMLSIQKKYYDFLRNFRADSIFKYREALTQHYRRGNSTVIVELSDVATFDTELLTSLQKRPDSQLRLFEAAAHDVLQRSMLPSFERIAAVFEP
jgi:DNA replication licensing factor MCM5